ncbi:MAG: acyl-CoA reductase [Chlorobi bacterium]|nr:acyl-CoA reductase [Chlorobiota bacterium]
MVSLEKRTEAFARLGRVLDTVVNDENIDADILSVSDEGIRFLSKLIEDSHHYNGWFVMENVEYMFNSIVRMLRKTNLEKWLSPYRYELEEKEKTNTVGVVMAGNLPLVGFHDFLSVLITGNRIVARLSGDDNKLLPAVTGLLFDIEPGFRDLVEFTETRLENFDAIIATGSDNTSRYFEYYFGKYPNIIRRNRNGVAVLTGNETESDMEKLSEDIFLYFGLGCRNVSKLFVPEGYDFDNLLEVLGRNKKIIENHKYFNNYEYNKAIYLVNRTPHFDSGNLLLTEDFRFASPVSVVYYEYYKDLNSVIETLKENREKIQCVVSGSENLENTVPFGKSQQPELWDYADGVDTLKFLLSL